VSSLYLIQSKTIAARVLGGEMIIMSPSDSIVFSLNKVGTVIWQAADGKTPLEEIVQRKVCVRFEVDPAEALKDAESFVRELVQHQLITLSDRPVQADQPRTWPGQSHQELP
jgi:hypothetical protein